MKKKIFSLERFSFKNITFKIKKLIHLKRYVVIYFYKDVPNFWTHFFAKLKKKIKVVPRHLYTCNLRQISEKIKYFII